MDNRKIGMISLGCPKNRVDSEIMLGYLKKSGYFLTGNINRAEVIIINTCGFITAAKEESIAAIFEAIDLKKKGKCKYILVAGCLPQRYGKVLLEEISEIDGLMGVGAVQNVPEVLRRILNGEKILDLNDSGDIPRGLIPRLLTTPGYYAYLKIAEGCENFCSYCAIPSIRGPYRSRPMEDIVGEAAELCAQGVKELIVVAQETTRYGIDLYGGYAIKDLLEKLEQLNNSQWIRLMYCHPATLNDELINFLGASNKMCRYIDLPLQHINNRILQLMNRRVNKEQIIELINKLRNTVPNIALRTTFIVGFPGETEEDFSELLDFMEQIKFERIGVFGFSPEEGTVAENLPGQLSQEVIASRLDRAMRLQQQISKLNGRKLINRVIDVLVEGWDSEINLYFGRSQADAPEIDGKVFFASHGVAMEGDIIKVKILDATEYDVTGVQLNELAQ